MPQGVEVPTMKLPNVNELASAKTIVLWEQFIVCSTSLLTVCSGGSLLYDLHPDLQAERPGERSPSSGDDMGDGVF